MAFRAERFRDFRDSGPTWTTQKRQLKISPFFQVVWLEKYAQTISMTGVEMRRKKEHLSSSAYVTRTTPLLTMLAQLQNSLL